MSKKKEKPINPEKMFKPASKSMQRWDDVYRGELGHAVKVAVSKVHGSPKGCCYECEEPRPEVKKELDRQMGDH